MQVGLVSTIIPVYNRPGLLEEAAHSVLGQTYRPIEIIIVDDESTDDTPAVIRQLESRHREIRSVRRTRGGPGQARESGRRIAAGEFIQYLDSDDRLLPRKFELQVAGLRQRQDCGVSYGFIRHLDLNGNPIPCTWKKANQVQEFLFPSFLVSRWWDTPAPLYRRSVCEAVGPWTDLSTEEDWERDCRVAALGIRLHVVREVVAEVRDPGPQRASRGGVLDPIRLRDRARAHALIHSHALRGRVDPSSPEMRHFARELFLLARQCGAAGLIAESRMLFGLASSSSADTRQWQYPIYRALASVFGWGTLGRASVLLDRLR